MTSMYGGDEISQFSNDIVDGHPKYAKFVNRVAPTAAGVTTTLVTGSPVIGGAVNVGATAASELAPDSFAKTVTFVGTVAITHIAATFLGPFLIAGFLIHEALNTKK
jgi:hypothetical protein